MPWHLEPARFLCRRTVRLGAELGDRVEVLDGVTASDRVVGSGSIMLKGRTQ